MVDLFQRPRSFFDAKYTILDNVIKVSTNNFGIFLKVAYWLTPPELIPFRETPTTVIFHSNNILTIVYPKQEDRPDTPKGAYDVDGKMYDCEQARTTTVTLTKGQ